MNLIESPINYMGSKYKLLDRLIPLFPKAETFVDLFTGGGSVYMNVNHTYKKVIANEYIKGVHQIHKNLKDKEFIQKAINYSVPTKHSQEAYLKLKKEREQLKNMAEETVGVVVTRLFEVKTISSISIKLHNGNEVTFELSDK